MIGGAGGGTAGTPSGADSPARAQSGEGRDGALDRAVHRDARLAQGLGRGVAAVHRVHDERAARGPDRVAERLGDRDLGAGHRLAVLAVAAEVAGDEQRVDLARVEQGAGGVVERADVLLAAAGEVDRVRGRGGRGQAGAQGGDGRRAEGGQLEARRVREAGRDPAVAAAVGEDRDAPSRRPPGAQQALGEVDHLLRRAHPLDPGGAAGGVDGGRVARQRAGVRADGARGRLGVLDRQEHDVLAGGAARPAAAAANARPSRKSST